MAIQNYCQYTDEHLQITVLESEDLRVIAIYRSSQDKYMCMLLANVIPASGNCLILGDINICSRGAPNHSVFKFLRKHGFNLLVSEASHSGGGALDQAWLRTSIVVPQMSNTVLYPAYFTCKDHDGILFSFFDPQKEKSRFSENICRKLKLNFRTRK